MARRGEIEDLLRRSAPRVLAAVVRRFGDFGESEDAVQEALLEASRQWPAQGVPESPVGWLIAVASRRMTDRIRAESARRRREDAVAAEPAAGPAAEADDTLVLMFMCCHPALTPASAIALTLRAVAGLTTPEIAAAFLVPEATMGQRIARAKKTIERSPEPFAMPPPAARSSRSTSRTARSGTGARSRRDWRSSPRPWPAAQSAPTSCRRRSPPSTTAPAGPRTPTGQRSPASMACSNGPAAGRWWR